MNGSINITTKLNTEIPMMLFVSLFKPYKVNDRKRITIVKSQLI